MSETKTLAINEDLGRPKIDNMNINCRQHAIPALDNNITPTPWYVSAFNPIPIDILRSRAKIIPQIKGKLQGVPYWHPLKGNRFKLTLPHSKLKNLSHRFAIIIILST